MITGDLVLFGSGLIIGIAIGLLLADLVARWHVKG